MVAFFEQYDISDALEHRVVANAVGHFSDDDGIDMQRSVWLRRYSKLCCLKLFYDINVFVHNIVKILFIIWGGLVLLVVDIGNTNTVLGVYSDDKLSSHWRLSSAGRTSDELAIFLQGLLASAGHPLDGFDGVVIASVVPRMEDIWRTMLQQTLGVDPYIVGREPFRFMRIDIDRPDEIGADRVVNSVAAVGRYGCPVVSVDLGTAVTFDVVSAEGAYIGGAIAPGLEVSVETLFSRTAKLPQVQLVRPEKVIGRDTRSAIRSGIIYGYIGMVDSIVERIFDELGTRTPVIATGGHASIIASESKTITHVEPWLTLDGMHMIFKKWKQI